MLGSLIGKWDRAGRNTHSNARSRPLISLTELSAFRRHLALGGVASELLITTSVLVGVFTYLDVPVFKTLLIGIAVTLQAALGTAVLTRVLSGIKCSLLLLIGPGVVVGGALSFALFQIVGRGWLGLVATTTAGLIAMFRLVRSTLWQPLETRSLWLISQVLGLAALALTWEFGELLPVAIAFFALGFFTSASPRFPTSVRWLVGIAVSGVIIAAFLLRQDYWWLITDDYQFFEVMSRHIISSGPLADWGASNWSRYHWLSYGWSGLLNLSGGNPESFVTLTRVMPGLYSLSLGASLVLIASFFDLDSKNRFFTTLPVWTVIAFHRLDWSGTSTSGVYAVLAAVAVLILLELTTTNSVGKRAAIYSIGVPTIALTKLPSLCAIFVFVTLIEIWNRSSIINRGKRLLLLAFSSFVVALLAVAAISLGGSIAGGWKFARVNSNLRQLAEFGPLFAAVGLLLQKLWIWVPVLVGVVWAPQRFLQPPKHITRGLAYCVSPLMLLALCLDVTIFGNANTTEYLSGPMYFLGSLLLIPLVPTLISPQSQTRVAPTIWLTISFLAVGYVWARLELGVELWDFIGVQILEWNGLKVALLQWVSGDGRFAIALTVLLSALIGFRNAVWRQMTVVAALPALSISTMGSYVDHSRNELAHDRSVGELAQNIGSAEIQSIGLWLKENSMPDDLIATNHIVDSNGNQLSSFDLAVWSERTFLVLGPRFGGKSPGKDRAVAISLGFADDPSEGTCDALSESDVRWFVVDLRLTQTRSWNVCTAAAYEHQDFVVLRLTR